jgi:hypothetical protein
LTGMFASNAIMYFIILTTAATLHAHGQTSIATAQQAAEALRPVAGAGAYLLFTIGLIGTGMLAVPVLAGSCAYAIAEASAWRGSLDRRPWQARKFYVVLAISVALGIVLNNFRLDAIKLLFTTADPHRPAAHRRSDGDGRRRQFAPPRLLRVDGVRGDGTRGSWPRLHHVITARSVARGYWTARLQGSSTQRSTRAPPVRPLDRQPTRLRSQPHA